MRSKPIDDVEKTSPRQERSYVSLNLLYMSTPLVNSLKQQFDLSPGVKSPCNEQVNFSHWTWNRPIGRYIPLVGCAYLLFL